MSEQTQTQTARDILKDTSREDYLKNTRKQMEAHAAELGIEDTSAHKTKDDLYDAMVKEADLPDPALRGESKVEDPVALTWQIADEAHRSAREAGEPKPRRKDCVQAAIDAGVAFYTARTQYQSWFQHTNKGENLLADGNLEGAPKSLQPAKPEPEVEVEE